MKNDQKGELASPEALAAARAARVLEDLLATADVAKVYGKPLRHGDVVLIPAAEVLAVAGFGAGAGTGRQPRASGRGGGGGGGGRAFARSVAVVEVSPAGVRVRPVLDLTKIALAALTAAGFVWSTWRAMSRSGRTGFWRS